MAYAGWVHGVVHSSDSSGICHLNQRNGLHHGLSQRRFHTQRHSSDSSGIYICHLNQRNGLHHGLSQHMPLESEEWTTPWTQPAQIPHPKKGNYLFLCCDLCKGLGSTLHLNILIMWDTHQFSDWKCLNSPRSISREWHVFNKECS